MIHSNFNPAICKHHRKDNPQDNKVSQEKIKQILDNAHDMQQLYEEKVNFLIAKNQELECSHSDSLDSLILEHEKVVEYNKQLQETNKQLLEKLETSSVQGTITKDVSDKLSSITQRLDSIPTQEKKPESVYQRLHKANLKHQKKKIA